MCAINDYLVLKNYVFHVYNQIFLYVCMCSDEPVAGAEGEGQLPGHPRACCSGERKALKRPQTYIHTDSHTYTSRIDHRHNCIHTF